MFIFQKKIKSRFHIPIFGDTYAEKEPTIPTLPYIFFKEFSSYFLVVNGLLIKKCAHF